MNQDPILQLPLQIQGFETLIDWDIDMTEPDNRIQENEHVIFKEGGVAIYSTIGKREKNLDKFSFICEEDFKIFGVYDGHGDDSVSLFLQNSLIRKIVTNPAFHQFPELALKQSFKEVEDYIISSQTEFPNEGSGSTALVVLVLKKSDEIIIANVGDGQAHVLNKLNDTWKRITSRHNLTEEQQLRKVTGKGAIVFKRGKRYRINGEMMLSRAIGDRKYKQFMTAEPEIICFKKSSLSEIVIGTDGFWEELHTKKGCNECFNREMNNLLGKMECSEISKISFADNATVAKYSF